MSDDKKYFDFTPVAMPSDIARYDDYITPDEQLHEATYEPTQWDDFNRANIDYLWEWIKNESDERVTATADMWRRIYTLLDNTSIHLRRFADALDKKWNSDASKVFLLEVGKSLYSLDEWKTIANTNAAGLDIIAGSIKKNQEKAKPIYLTYVKAINDPGSVAGSAPKEGLFSTESEDDRKKRLRQDYTKQIKPFVRDLADTYMEVFFHHLSRGGKYKGPTDAVFPTPPVQPHGKLPPGGLPTPTFPKPNLPKQKLPDPNLMHITGQPTPDLPTADLPTADLPTADPHSLTLAGQMTAMPQVDMPSVPNMPTVSAPPPPNVPPMPVPPGMPNVGGRPPGAGEPGAASEPAGTRPPMPGRPNLSGQRKPGQARPPAPGRGRPNLRGAKGRSGLQAEGSDLREEVEHPNARGPMSPRLAGRRDGTSGQRPGTGSEEEPPGRGPGMRTRAGEESERLSGRRRPNATEEEQEAFREHGAGRPDLEGRSAARHGAVPAEPEEAGHGPTLGGRNAQPAKARRTGDAGRQDEYDFVPEPGGEDRLWEVEQAAPTVIDAPHPPRRADPGPALGRPD